MLVERFNALHGRLEALKTGRPPPLALITRARLLFSRLAHDTALPRLEALDRALDGAGVHTAADARLLRELGESKGRLGQLSRGLVELAGVAMDEYEDSLSLAEQLAALGQLEPGVPTALDGAFAKLARVVKVAAVFLAPAGAPVAFELFPRAAQAPGRAPLSARVAVAEFLAGRARGNAVDSAQKRRDVDMAYELVLRMSAEAKEDRDRVRRLRIELAEARDRVRQSPGVRSLDELVRHLRHAARHDPRTAYRSVRALYERAVESEDAALAGVAHRALDALAGAPAPGALRAAIERDQARRMLGLRGPLGHAAGEDVPPGGAPGATDQVGDVLAQLAFSLDEDQQRAIELSAGAGRFFDVEDSLSEELVEAETRSTRPVVRKVPYPTQQMSYEFTGSLDEVHNFVISHPGTLVVDLAAGRQMVRAYVEEAPRKKPRRVKKTSVRVYVLDASGSMHGARARFRDAILIAELNAIRVKARAGLPFDPLYFSYFNDSPTELARVDSGPEATRHIEKLFARSPAEGQTDITLALMSAFESIQRAQGKDPYLARATVVLVTDGEDGVDLDLIRRTKKPFEGLDIALSFISLGEENGDLKSLVLEQRQAGGRAFYHHLSDAEIQLVRTEFDTAWRTLVPLDVAVGPEALERLAPHLEALEALAQGQPAPVAVRSDSQFDTLFPREPPGDGKPAAGKLRARLLDVLDAIAEAAPLAAPERRAAEAVELLMHLLAVYQIPPAAYLEVVGDPALAPALGRVRLLCKPFD